MKPIMLATDGSPSAEAATCQAIELAQAFHAPLLVVSVAHVSLPVYGAYYGYGRSYFYAPAPVYYGPSPGCFWRNQRFWDGNTWRVQRVQACN